MQDTLENAFESAKNGVTFLFCQKASDNPCKGTITLCINVKQTTGWGLQYVFSYNNILHRSIENKVFSEWKAIK